MDCGWSFIRSVKRRAFSLVDLLVVIGIVGILIAILMPALNTAREAEKTVRCASQLRQIGIAIFAYASVNRGYLPMHSSWHSYPNDMNKDDPWGPGWIMGIKPYTRAEPDSPLYCCPAFPGDSRPVTYFLECHWMHLQNPPVHTFPMSTIKLSSMFILCSEVTNIFWYEPPVGTWPYGYDNIDKDDADDGPEHRCLEFFGEDGGFNLHRAGNNIFFADGHVQPFKHFDSTFMTYNPHLVQNWTELTGD